MSHVIMDIVVYDLPGENKAYRILTYTIPDVLEGYTEDTHKEDDHEQS